MNISRSRQWHLLQVSDVLDEEFASALAERVHLTAWEPHRQLFPPIGASNFLPPRHSANPPLDIERFRIVRGFSRLPWSVLARTGATVAAQLLEMSSDPQTSPLICTSPYFASVAEHWPGPIIYWLTDMMASYEGVNPMVVRDLDRRMVAVATMVCPNSHRIADYLRSEALCPASKVRIIPNATRSSNLLPKPPRFRGLPPQDMAHLPNPIAGVIGNLAGNMDWTFLEQLMQLVPGVSWVFVGPTTMPIPMKDQREARSRVMMRADAHFLGKKPYGDLAAYARAFDVAVLPYRRCEPTYSGSSTRFYEHLAACRPMMATRGFEELLHKEPLLQLVDSADDAAEYLRSLLAIGFDDGLLRQRWTASQSGTWQTRAAFMEEQLEELLLPRSQTEVQKPPLFAMVFANETQ